MRSAAPGQSGFFRYGTSVVAVGGALALKLLLIPLVSQAEPFLLFSLAVMVAALYGGLGPGLFATALASVCNFYFFMHPFNQFAFGDAYQPAQLSLFVIEGAGISVICD